jgi:hypothetical protein
MEAKPSPTTAKVPTPRTALKTVLCGLIAASEITRRTCRTPVDSCSYTEDEY